MKVLQKLFRPFIPEKSPEIPKVQSKYLITCDWNMLITRPNGNGIHPRHTEKVLDIEQAQRWISEHILEMQTITDFSKYKQLLTYEHLFTYLHFNLQTVAYFPSYESQDFEEILYISQSGRYEGCLLNFSLLKSNQNPIPPLGPGVFE